MLWVNRGAGSGSSSASSASQTPATGPFKANDLVAWAIGQDVAAATVTGIACDNGSGSFLELVTGSATARSLAIWIGYGFSGDPAAVTITCSQAGFAYVRHHLTTDLDWTGWTPSVDAAAWATGSSQTGLTSGLVSALGDILFTALVMPSTTADSTARTHTGNTFLFNTGGEFTGTATRVEFGFCPEVKSTASTTESWALGSSVAWAAALARVRPPATLITASAAKVVKGRATLTLDDAAVA